LSLLLWLRKTSKVSSGKGISWETGAPSVYQRLDGPDREARNRLTASPSGRHSSSPGCEPWGGYRSAIDRPSIGSVIDPRDRSAIRYRSAIGPRYAAPGGSHGWGGPMPSQGSHPGLEECRPDGLAMSCPGWAVPLAPAVPLRRRPAVPVASDRFSFRTWAVSTGRLPRDWNVAPRPRVVAAGPCRGARPVFPVPAVSAVSAVPSFPPIPEPRIRNSYSSNPRGGA
jgi:hypothetical protein